jgi:hypothetical protein
LVTTGTSNSVALSSASTGGNLIVAYVVWDSQSSVTMTDSRGNTYQSAVGPTTWGNGYRAQVLYAKNIIGGGSSITATFGAAISSFGIVYAHEYAGVDRVNPVDAVAANSGASGSLNSGTLTTSTSNDLLFGAGASDNVITGVGSGYAVRSTAYGNLTEDRATATAGSYTATATQNGNAWVMQAVAFRGAVPGDLDHDGHTDREDLDRLDACSSGPAIPYDDPACAEADLDGDGDVDQSDFGLLQSYLGATGPT